jgi:hypothetical protein
VILFTGDLTTSWSRFGPVVEAEVAGHMLAGTPPRLMITTDSELSRLRGAGALVLQRHSGYHRSTHSAPNESSIRKRRDRTITNVSMGR